MFPIERFNQKQQLAASKYAYDVIKVQVKDCCDEEEPDESKVPTATN